MMVEAKECQDNVVYVGKKFYMRYVAALLMKFNYFKCSKVIVKARGKAISKAIHATKVFIDTFNNDVRYGNINLGSMNIDIEGRRFRLSTIEIELLRS